MYFGALPIKEITYTRPDSQIPFLPTIEDGKNKWLWSDLYETAFDINILLEKECFISTLLLNAQSDSINKLEIFVDKKLSHTSFEASLTENSSFSVNASGKSITIRIFANIADIIIEDIQFFGSLDDKMPLIWPTPNSFILENGFVNISVILANNDEEKAAADFLTNRLNLQNISLCDCGVPLHFVLNSSPEFLQERYKVEVQNDKIVITAATRLCLIYGADALMQTLDKNGFPLCVIDDKPALSFRGFHIGLPSEEYMDFAKQLLQNVLIPLRYNTLIIEFAGAMRFDSHPEIAEAWLDADEKERQGLQPLMPHAKLCGNRSVVSKEAVRDFAAFARSLGISFVPEIQSFGHVQWLTYAHPEIAEKVDVTHKVEDTRFEDARPDEFYPHCYCPSNEKSYEIIFDLIDEIIETVNPEYIHIGHDEIYNLGCCPICQKRDPVDIFVDDVNKIYSYIKSKGKKVMMWSDHFHALRAYSALTHGALGRVPKDILMLDFTWYFDPDKDIEVELLENGYSVVLGNLYSSHFTRYSSRASRKGIVGGQFSLWVTTKEDRIADNGKFWDAMVVSQMLWRADKYDSNLLSAYSNVLSDKIQPIMRDKMRSTNTYAGFDFSLNPQKIEIVDSAKVNIDEYCTALRFKHATKFADRRIPWEEYFLVGTYFVKYTDGSVEEIPVRYGSEILCYKGYYGQPLAGQVHRHQGYVGTWYSDPVIKDKDNLGNDVTIYGFIWNNPSPEKKIASVSFASSPESFTGFIFTGIDAQIKKD